MDDPTRFHGGNRGSNPLGDANIINALRLCWLRLKSRADWRPAASSNGSLARASYRVSRRLLTSATLTRARAWRAPAWRYRGCGRSFRSAALPGSCSSCGRRGLLGCQLLLALLCLRHQFTQNTRRCTEAARGLEALERLPARELWPVGTLLHGRIVPRGLR
jgi:hypothetical protein